VGSLDDKKPEPYRSAVEVEAARDDHDWGSLHWLANAEIGNAAGLTLGRVVIRRGQSNPRHCHPTCEEVLYLLSGRLEHTLGDATFTLNPGDTLSIPAGVFHNAASTGEEDAEMIVAYSSAHRDYLPEP
jgi:quercetin dioxygenase-like cupin family protein